MYKNLTLIYKNLTLIYKNLTQIYKNLTQIYKNLTQIARTTYWQGPSRLVRVPILSVLYQNSWIV